MLMVYKPIIKGEKFIVGVDPLGHCACVCARDEWILGGSGEAHRLERLPKSPPRSLRTDEVKGKGRRVHSNGLFTR